MEKEASQITLHAERRNTEKIFKEFFKDNSTFKSHRSKDTVDPKLLKEHFENHFDVLKNLVTPEEIIEMPDYLKHLQEIDSIKQGPPYEIEISNARWEGVSDSNYTFCHEFLQKQNIDQLPILICGHVPAIQ